MAVVKIFGICYLLRLEAEPTLTDRKLQREKLPKLNTIPL